MKKKVLVCGCNGKMGQNVCSLISKTDDLKVTCGFDMIEDFSGPFPIYNQYTKLYMNSDIPDVIIDFSSDAATKVILQYAWAKRVPIVVATTKLSESVMSDIQNMSKSMPVFQSANMSIEVNLVKHVLEEIARELPSAAVEITETHHDRKKDAPSGTANTFADAIQKVLEEENGFSYDIVYGRTSERKKNEIGICSKRGGNIVGTHTIEFFSPFETLEITHTAHSRELFADGAIKAARFILDKESGLYGMDDLSK